MLLTMGVIPLTERNVVAWSMGVFFSGCALLGVLAACLIYLAQRVRRSDFG